MPIEKPLPLMVGNKAFYSLTSYGPVEITVDVPYTSDEDIEYSVAATVRDMGGTEESLEDPTWLSEHFDGLTTKNQVLEAMRQELAHMSERIVEQQKASKCVEALGARLCQSIPPMHLEQTKMAVRQRFVDQLRAEGMTPEQFMARSAISTAQLDNMLDQQALQMAEGSAALSAYAHEKKLKVDEHEFGRLLGIPAEELEGVISQARSAGQYDDLREAALRSKAAQIVLAECSCTYKHETPQEARQRMAQLRQMEQMYAQRFEDEPQDGAPDAGTTGFKLV